MVRLWGEGADAKAAFRLSVVKRYYTEKGVATLHPEGAMSVAK